MARKGRDLEQLVELLERVLSDGPAIEIKSPEYMRGVNSESNREIDVTHTVSCRWH